jgi:hypothetical protein
MRFNCLARGFVDQLVVQKYLNCTTGEILQIADSDIVEPGALNQLVEILSIFCFEHETFHYDLNDFVFDSLMGIFDALVVGGLFDE